MIALIFIMSLSLNFSLAHSYCPPGACPNILRFTCQDYTAGLVLELRSYGVDAYPIYGWRDSTPSPHTWVGVEFNGQFYNIEPQTGKLVYPDSEHYLNGRRGTARGVA